MSADDSQAPTSDRTTHAVAGPPLRVVYRSYGGENMKGRPAWYSKQLGLLSLLRAVDRVEPPVELVFANDGPIPSPRLEVMVAAGEIEPVVGGSNRRSYRAVLDREARRPGPPESLVWFAEDDYLYRPDALVALTAGAGAIPNADYLTLYGWECLDTARPRIRPLPRPLPGAAAEPSPVALGDLVWYRALSTASTFGVRRRVLQEDVTLLRTAPYTGGAWDETSCLTYQGLFPFTGRELLDDLRGRDPELSPARSAVRAVTRAAACARALRRPSRRRVLVGTDPEMIRHMELPELSPRTPRADEHTDTFWSDLADETWSWARERGLVDASSTGRTS